MRAYYRLIKPGIVYGNVLTALAAFLFASWPSVEIPLLIATLLGLALVIAGSCALNNVIDRDIDAKMERTKDRAIPTGTIPLTHAVFFGGALLLAGFGTLFFFTSVLTALAAGFGALVYLCFYTPMKRWTLHSTIVGALAGAAPPVVGYVAATGEIDATALVLFLILTTWQMVHFFAIGIFRRTEYTAAGIPIMPVALGVLPTKAAMIAHAFAFLLAVSSLSFVHATSAGYRFAFIPLAGLWFLLAISGWTTKDDIRWARMMFFYSIGVLMLFCLALAIP